MHGRHTAAERVGCEEEEEAEEEEEEEEGTQKGE